MTAVGTCQGGCPGSQISAARAGSQISAPRAGELDFELPEARIATEPAEVRGAGRDDVRLMVARGHDGSIVNEKFTAIVDGLAPGDLLVVNVAATLPAAIPVIRDDGTALRAHLSTQLSDEVWSVEIREPSGVGSLPWADGRQGEVFLLPAGGCVELLAPYLAPGSGDSRLWRVALRLPAPLDVYLEEHGAPIRYGTGGQAWPMEAYQTVYASGPGGAEMPSAGRAFTPELLTRLVSRGVGVAPVVLLSGVSSPEAHEPPYPERYRVSRDTAARINAARAGGGRIVATGTTVVRALETCVDAHNRVRAGSGWTDLVIAPRSRPLGPAPRSRPLGPGAGRPPLVVDGLLTGWHEPGASHLRLLEAVAGRSLLERCYAEALAGDYLWHEFGDLLLLLP